MLVEIEKKRKKSNNKNNNEGIECCVYVHVCVLIPFKYAQHLHVITVQIMLENDTLKTFCKFVLLTKKFFNKNNQIKAKKKKFIENA